MRGYILLACMTLGGMVHAQISKFNPADSENRSSILNQPSSIGLDVTNEEINVEFNNIQSQHSTKNKWLLGLKFTGGNSDKESSIFKGGKFTLGSQLEGFMGGSILLEDSTMQAIESRISSKKNRLSGTYSEALHNANESMKTYFNNGGVPSIIKSRVKEILFGSTGLDSAKSLGQYENVGSWQDSLKKVRWNPKFLDEVKDYQIISADSIALFGVLTPIVQNISYTLSEQGKNQLKTEIDILTSSLQTYRDSVGVNRFSFFTRGGINGHTFTRVDTLSDGALSFDKNEFRGGYMEGGVNFFIKGSVYIGASYRYSWNDNLSDLKSTSFSIKQTETISGQEFQYEQTEKGYIGRYYTFREEIFFIDAAWVSLPMKDGSRFMFHGYTRLNFPNAKDSQRFGLKDSQVFGMGSNFFKRDEQFLIGLFAEFPRFYSNLSFHKFGIGLRASYAFSKLY